MANITPLLDDSGVNFIILYQGIGTETGCLTLFRWSYVTTGRFEITGYWSPVTGLKYYDDS